MSSFPIEMSHLSPFLSLFNLLIAPSGRLLSPSAYPYRMLSEKTGHFCPEKDKMGQFIFFCWAKPASSRTLHPSTKCHPWHGICPSAALMTAVQIPCQGMNFHSPSIISNPLSIKLPREYRSTVKQFQIKNFT